MTDQLAVVEMPVEDYDAGGLCRDKRPGLSG